jgi:hypothetical protein
MAKNQMSVYISDSSRRWIEKFHPTDTKSGSVGFIAEWAIHRLRSGLLDAFRALDQEERVVVIASLKDFTLDPDMVDLGTHAKNWLSSMEGKIDFWYDYEGETEAFINKLNKLNPAQTMALICWGLAFWQNNTRAADDEFVVIEIDRYAEDSRDLFV